MFRVKIVGAGQLGSRHLQALRAVKKPLEIHVIDPSDASLSVAKERYESLPPGTEHQVTFNTDFAKTGLTDIAIVATSSDTRKKVLDGLLDASDVKYIVLEKLLFNERADYAAAQAKLDQSGAKAWVNCCMRVMPPYEKIRAVLAKSPLSYRVTGSQFGLVTNAIHYIDHAVHLTGCNEFTVDTSGLDAAPIASKRKGFVELNGTLVANFADGSRCEVTCYAGGSAPVVVELFNDKQRFIVRESEGKLWQSSEDSKWLWEEHAAVIPYQSQMTTNIVETLLAKGECGLSPYASSARTHLQLLEPLLVFVKKSAPETKSYPFT